MSFIANALNNRALANVNTITLTSSTMYTPPDNLRTAIFLLQAAGGGGGGAFNGGSFTTSVGGAGIGGQWGQVTLQPSDFTGPVTVTVGLAGSGGVGNAAGTAGGDTVISGGVTTRSVPGGLAGTAPDVVGNGQYFISDARVLPTPTGTFDWIGQPSQHSNLIFNRVVGELRVLARPQGGGFFAGNFTAANTLSAGSQANGSPGLLPGCGGHGARNSQPISGTQTGGNGADGVVIIYEFLAEQ